jgi:putative transposase
VEQLYDESVATVYVGDLTDVLLEHWSLGVNGKTHQFWAHRLLVDRLGTTANECGIRVELRSEAFTTATCVACGERLETKRCGDVFRGSCGYEGHTDLDASRTFLERETGTAFERGPMARPVRLTWDDHNWSELSRSPERARFNEERTNQSTSDGKVASVGR